MIEEQNIEEYKKKLEWYEKKYGPYIEKRGLHNWRNLFRKPNLLEWTILFMLVMSLFIAWAYQQDTHLCRDTLSDLSMIACNICSAQVNVSGSQVDNPLANHLDSNYSFLKRPSNDNLTPG